MFPPNPLACAELTDSLESFVVPVGGFGTVEEYEPLAALTLAAMNACEGYEVPDPEPKPKPKAPVRPHIEWSGQIEQWRPLVTKYFVNVDTAMAVMACESGGNPNAYNRSGASGLFQHLGKYWAERSWAAGWGGADIWDPEANVAVAAWLAHTGGWVHWSCWLKGAGR